MTQRGPQGRMADGNHPVHKREVLATPPETPVCVLTRVVQKKAEMSSVTYPQGSEASSSPNARDPILFKRK